MPLLPSGASVKGLELQYRSHVSEVITHTQVPKSPGCAFPSTEKEECTFRIEHCQFQLLLVNPVGLCWGLPVCLKQICGFQSRTSQERPRVQRASEHSCGPSAAITVSSAALFQPPPVGHSVWTPPAPLPGQDRVWPICCWGA